MNKKTALITGFGQDSSYLAEFLLKLNYNVVITTRSKNIHFPESFDQNQLKSISGNFEFVNFDLLAPSDQFDRILEDFRPSEVYHLAAQSHVGDSFARPVVTFDTNAQGTLAILEAIYRSPRRDEIKLYNAATSEIFGNSSPPQSELTCFAPASPYAISKLAAFELVRQYRKSYGLLAWNGILFNHESPRRHPSFVTRKITVALAYILSGKMDCLELGNLSAERDWGYAPEYVEVMWYMLQSDQPDDYVIGTGETHSVGEFVRDAFAYVGLDWEQYVRYDVDRNKRPSDVHFLQANCRKAEKHLGWKPKVLYRDLVKIMVDADIALAGRCPKGDGLQFLADIELEKDLERV